MACHLSQESATVSHFSEWDLFWGVEVEDVSGSCKDGQEGPYSSPPQHPSIPLPALVTQPPKGLGGTHWLQRALSGPRTVALNLWVATPLVGRMTLPPPENTDFYYDL